MNKFYTLARKVGIGFCFLWRKCFSFGICGRREKEIHNIKV
ncbi:hypothetical protein HMPREF9996_00269 [Aggregatibacter actinomycetemcomitans Y4]|nr:hypothetical protein HMPREF9996_00269 [Aggregatibacter actinomycetemcomitans Y4]